MAVNQYFSANFSCIGGGYCAIYDSKKEVCPLSYEKKQNHINCCYCLSLSKWLAFISNNVIPDMLQYKDYDYIKEALHGLTPEDAKPATPITSSQSKIKEVKEEKVAPKTVTVTGEIPVGEGISIATLDAMDRSALEGLIESRSLSTDPKEWDDEESLREAIKLEMDLTN